MKIGWNDCIGGLKTDVAAVYLKAGKWRIYDQLATYEIKNQKAAELLIDEVMEVENVPRNRVKLVKIETLSCKEVKFREQGAKRRKRMV